MKLNEVSAGLLLFLFQLGQKSPSLLFSLKGKIYFSRELVVIQFLCSNIFSSPSTFWEGRVSNNIRKFGSGRGDGRFGGKGRIGV
jgi:hypothetical protein